MNRRVIIGAAVAILLGLGLAVLVTDTTIPSFFWPGDSDDEPGTAPATPPRRPPGWAPPPIYVADQDPLPADVPGLIAALETARAGRRTRICEALHALGADAVDALPALTAVAETDGSATVRVAAIRAIVALGGRTIGKKLVWLLRHDAEAVRAEALRGLTRNADPTWTKALLARATNRRFTPRYLVIDALAALTSDRRAARALAERATDTAEDQTIRLRAVAHLRAFAASFPEAAKALEACRTDTDAKVAAVARAASTRGSE